MSDRDVYEAEDETVTVTENPNPNERGKWVSMLVALLGLWLLIEAVVFGMTAANFWNDVIIGLALIALGGYNYYRRADERLGSVSAGVFVALLGLWMIAAPFVLGTETAAAQEQVSFWNDVVVGALALILGAYSAYEASSDTEHTAAAAR